MTANKKKSRQLVIGILTTPAKNIFHSNYHLALLSGIRPAIKSARARLKIIMMPEKSYEALDEILCENKVDGLLILTWRWIHPSIAKLIETQKNNRVLAVNDPVENLQVHNLYTDTDYGMSLAVNRLKEKGFKKIGMLHGPFDVLFKVNGRVRKSPFIDTQLKINGLLRALRLQKIKVNKNWFRGSTANSETEGYKVCRKWFLEKNIPEAVVCGNDDLAFGALRASRELRKKIAVIGFDDNEHAAKFNPPLTTVKQPLKQIGKDAVDILIKSMRKPNFAIVSRKYSPELIARKSA